MLLFISKWPTFTYLWPTTTQYGSFLFERLLLTNQDVRFIRKGVNIYWGQDQPYINWGFLVHMKLHSSLEPHLQGERNTVSQLLLTGQKRMSARPQLLRYRRALCYCHHRIFKLKGTLEAISSKPSNLQMGNWAPWRWGRSFKSIHPGGRSRPAPQGLSRSQSLANSPHSQPLIITYYFSSLTNITLKIFHFQKEKGIPPFSVQFMSPTYFWWADVFFSTAFVDSRYT